MAEHPPNCSITSPAEWGWQWAPPTPDPLALDHDLGLQQVDEGKMTPDEVNLLVTAMCVPYESPKLRSQTSPPEPPEEEGDDDTSDDSTTVSMVAQALLPRVDPPHRIVRSFVFMAVCFSMNHGAVAGALSLASSVLGTDLGGTGAGTLFLCYTLCALLAASTIVQRLGDKWSLVAGLTLYTIYLACFLGALLCDPRAEPEEESARPCAWWLFVGGAALGGFAAGFYWPAQGAYFAKSAFFYAKMRRKDQKWATSKFAGIFASVYLGFELVVKLSSFAVLSAVDDEQKANKIIFTVFASVAVVSAAGMVFVPPVTDDAVPLRQSGSPPMLDTVKMLFGNPLMALLAPVNLTFGCMSAFINNVVNARIIKAQLGEKAVPLLSAVIPGVAALVSMPLAMAVRRSKLPGMVAGMLLFASEALCYLVLPVEVLGRWQVILPLLVVQGCARAVWEGPNKGVVADFFPTKELRDAAFANLVLQNGIASSFGFYAFPPLLHAHGKDPLAAICLGLAATACISYPAAHLLHRKYKRKGYSPLNTSEKPAPDGEESEDDRSYALAE